MVSTSDTISLVFGLTATLLAAGAIWVARRSSASMPSTMETNSDIELGLLNPPPSITQDDESHQSTPPVVTSGPEEERRPFHDVIAETLELLSRHLRAYH